MTEMEECLERLKVGKDIQSDVAKAKMHKLQDEYEKSIQHTSQIPPYGIKGVNETCSYPVEIGDKKNGVCSEEVERKKPRLCP